MSDQKPARTDDDGPGSASTEDTTGPTADNSGGIEANEVDPERAHIDPTGD